MVGVFGALSAGIPGHKITKSIFRFITFYYIDSTYGARALPPWEDPSCLQSGKCLYISLPVPKIEN